MGGVKGESSGGRERRLHPRFEVSLECSVRLPDDEQSSSRLLFPGAKIAGRTRDASAGGLGLVLDSIYIGYDCVVDEGRTLVVTLALPAGDIELKGTPVHYVRQDAGGGQVIYLVGLRITEISDGARARFNEFLSERQK